MWSRDEEENVLRLSGKLKIEIGGRWQFFLIIFKLECPIKFNPSMGLVPNWERNLNNF